MPDRDEADSSATVVNIAGTTLYRPRHVVKTNTE